MGWNNAKQSHNSVRQTEYNKSLVMSFNGLNTMVASFDTFWGGLLNITDEISHITLLPMRIKISRYGELNTSNFGGGIVYANCAVMDNDNYYYLGQYKVNPVNNDFTDYNGYSSLTLYLPFVGFVDIDINECYNKWLQFRFIIDYQSCKGVYIIGVSDTGITHADVDHIPIDEDIYNVLATYEADLGIPIPLGMSNWSDTVRNFTMGAVKTALNTGASIYSATLPPATTTTTTTGSRIRTYDVKGARKAKNARLKTIKGGSVTDTAESTKTTTIDRPTNESRPFSELTNGFINAVSNISKNGSTGDRLGNGGLSWGISNSIYVIRRSPKKHIAFNRDDYNKLYGAPLGNVVNLDILEGYTEISSIHIEGEGFKNTTLKEMNLLRDMLNGGVIL